MADLNVLYNPTYYTNSNPNGNFQENTYQRKYNNYNEAYQKNKPIIEKQNYSNQNNLIHNNVREYVKKEDIKEYTIDIDSINRNIDLYPDPFEYSVTFNTSSTKTKEGIAYNSPQINRAFRNVKYIRVDNVSLPKVYDLTCSSIVDNEGYNRRAEDYVDIFDSSLQNYNPRIQDYYTSSNPSYKNYNNHYETDKVDFNRYYTPIFDPTSTDINTLLDKELAYQRIEVSTPFLNTYDIKMRKEYDNPTTTTELKDKTNIIIIREGDKLNGQRITRDDKVKIEESKIIITNRQREFEVDISEKIEKNGVEITTTGKTIIINHTKIEVKDSTSTTTTQTQTQTEDNYYFPYYDTSRVTTEGALLVYEVSNIEAFVPYPAYDIIKEDKENMYDETDKDDLKTLLTLKVSLPMLTTYNTHDRLYDSKYDKRVNPDIDYSTLDLKYAPQLKEYYFSRYTHRSKYYCPIFDETCKEGYTEDDAPKYCKIDQETMMHEIDEEAHDYKYTEGRPLYTDATDEDKIKILRASLFFLPTYNPRSPYYDITLDKKKNPYASYNDLKFEPSLQTCIPAIIPYVGKYNPRYYINYDRYNLYNDRFVVIRLDNIGENSVYSSEETVSNKGIKLQHKNDTIEGHYFLTVPLSNTNTYYFKDGSLGNLNKINIKFYDGEYNQIKMKNIDKNDNNRHSIRNPLNKYLQNNITITIGVVENEINNEINYR